MTLHELTPTCAIVTIGDELVEGRVDNGNATWLAHELLQVGLWPRLMIAVPDDESSISRILPMAARMVDIVIVCGGLGFTPDDVTRRAVAQAFGCDITVDTDMAAIIFEACEWASDEVATAVATFPVGSVPIPSACGGVPGFTLGNVHVLPGSPTEMRAMFAALPLPQTGGRVLNHVSTWMTKEHAVNDILKAFDTYNERVGLGCFVGVKDAPLTIVLTSRSAEALARAVAWLSPRMEAVSDRKH